MTVSTPTTMKAAVFEGHERIVLEDAYGLFGNQRDGVITIALTR